MSDGVLAAIIAAGATVFTSFVQLRTSFAKEIAARARAGPSRGKTHMLPILLVVMLVGAAVGGFALAQWVHESERDAQQALVRDLRERIGDLTRYKNDIEQSRAELRSVMETEAFRRIGADGVVVLATAAPCKRSVAVAGAAVPALASSTTVASSTTLAPPAALAASMPAAKAVLASSPPAVPRSPGPPPVATCAESDAVPITLCATIPAAAQLGGVELYVRQTDEAGHWTDNRVMPGEASAQARFAAKPVELADGPAMKQVCVGFTQWSDQTRVARMVVHYSL
jgi:hypothetical protein